MATIYKPKQWQNTPTPDRSNVVGFVRQQPTGATFFDPKEAEASKMDALDMLDTLRKRVVSGEVVGVAFAAVCQDGPNSPFISHSFSHGTQLHYFETIAALEALKYRIMNRFMPEEC